MGKVTAFATDIFYCLFGVFAALFALAPKEPFGVPFRPEFSMEWTANSAMECLSDVVLYVDGSLVDLRLARPASANFSNGTCVTSRTVDGISGGFSSIELFLSRPFSKACVSFTLNETEGSECPDAASPTVSLKWSDTNG